MPLILRDLDLIHTYANECDCRTNEVAKKRTERRRSGRRQPFLTDATVIHDRIAGADRQLMEGAVAAAGKSFSNWVREKLSPPSGPQTQPCPPCNALVFAPVVLTPAVE